MKNKMNKLSAFASHTGKQELQKASFNLASTSHQNQTAQLSRSHTGEMMKNISMKLPKNTRIRKIMNFLKFMSHLLRKD